MVHSHRKRKCSYEDITNQLLRNNKYILNDGKSLYHAFFHNTCGIRKVGDLVSKGNIFLGSEKILNSKLTVNQYFLLLGVVSAIPNEWRSTIKGKSVHVEPYPFIENSFQMPIRGKVFDLSRISSKILYREFRSLKEIPSITQAKLKDGYPNLSVDRKEICLLVLNIILDTKVRVPKYKF